MERTGEAEVEDEPSVAHARRGAAPDLAALYAQHRGAMYRVAYSTLRPSGMVASAEDAVGAAVVSLMKSGLPTNVVNWEAFLVKAVKRKAQDIVKSAAVRRAGPSLDDLHGRTADSDVGEEVAERVDLQQQLSRMRASLDVLNERQRLVAVEHIGLERPRAEIAAQLGVTPARVSQMKLEVLKLLRDAMAGREDQR